MKNIFCLLSSFFIFFSCNQPGYYQIKGEVLDERFENQIIYFAPLENATKENIDSTYITNGKFYFEGLFGSDEIRVIYTTSFASLFLQELLIVLEPGTIYVTLGKNSTATGTNQNNLLQQWKEKKEDVMTRVQNLQRWLKTSKEDLSSEEIQEIESNIQIIENEFIEDNYNFIQQHWYTTVGQFVYKMVGNSLTEEQKESLKLLETVQ
ncbi:MAG: DUF4369 domain-containing protein [Tannerellaceae bacterium]|nr:DUF4369 domain-containing protein [Tannerellaceae bacterium]